MSKIILDPRIEEAIFNASESDPFQLSLALKGFPENERIFLAVQVEARQKAKEKIPEFVHHRKVLFPSAEAVEQASSSTAARYKSRLVKGGTLVDLTGGLGVDTFFFTRVAEKVVYLERDEEVAEFADHNFRVMGVNNVQVIHDDGLDYIRKVGEQPDYLYIDPSRRRGGRRVFRIEDAEPDVGALHQELLNYSTRLIIKLSPLMDVKYLIRHFHYIREIHILAIGQECKEIIISLDKRDFSQDPSVITCCIEHGAEQVFETSWEKNKFPCPFDRPHRFIYDSNVAIRKSGLYHELGNRFRLKKLAPNSHLFTGNELVDAFPGRCFQLLKTMSIQDFLKGKTITRAHIATRNFPMKVTEIRKRTGIGEGGDRYVFCTTQLNGEPVVLLTQKA